MRLSKMVTLLLAGFLTFGSLNSVAATKHAKAPIVKKLDASKKKKAQAVKSSKTFAKKVKKKTSVKNKHKQMASQHFNQVRQVITQMNSTGIALQMVNVSVTLQ